MPDTRRRHRAFLVLASTTAVIFLAVIGAYAVWGHTALEAVWRDPESSWRPRLAAVLRPQNLALTLELADRAFGEGMAMFAALASLAALLYVLGVVRPGWGRGALLVLLWWLAVELLAGPRLVYQFRLNHWAFVQDPDHWPRGVTGVPGWNSDGLRQGREAADYAEEDTVILFLGDSFTMGFALKQAHVQAFPWVVERELQGRFPDARLTVANFGWTSASPLLSARRFEAIGARYKPDLVVLCIDMGDAQDDLKYRNLIDRRGLVALYDRLPLTIGLLRAYAPDMWWRALSWSVGHNQPFLRFFWTEQPLEESRPFLAEIEQNIARCAAGARAGRGLRGCRVPALPPVLGPGVPKGPRAGEALRRALGPRPLGPRALPLAGRAGPAGRLPGDLAARGLPDDRRPPAHRGRRRPLERGRTPDRG